MEDGTESCIHELIKGDFNKCTPSEFPNEGKRINTETISLCIHILLSYVIDDDPFVVPLYSLYKYDVLQSRIKELKESTENEISSIIEIEVEMDSDVLAAEAAGNAENIAEQIQQIMELENLEEKWKIQAEANDEAEVASQI
ncbi:hypothetical protein HAX54_017416 [Datura stramonium]|uniref:Uncharacterized protein n=1 Tax=Datura stramonium TaxID=4076 RepID=A0ABS8UMU2_DATST|nr:hypothetical protein [Datura stramonium]